MKDVYFNFYESLKKLEKEYETECKYCEKYSGKYELCKECYEKSLNNEIIKNDNGIWIKNIKFGREKYYYDENKTYILKEKILSNNELILYKILKKTLKQYDITPQANLQSFIETDSYKRNDELFRNIDFVIYNQNYSPILAIELNGKEHYINQEKIERDKSIKSILKEINLPLLTIKNETLKRIDEKNVSFILKEVIKFIEYKKRTSSRKISLKRFEMILDEL